MGSDTTTYTYDALGNLRAVDLPGTDDDIAYGIDGLGRRVERRVGATVTHRWIYDRADRIVAELDAGNDLVASYAYLPDQNTPILMRRGGTTYRLVSDKVGSVRLVVNTGDGSVAQRIDYDPFGVPSFSGPQSGGFVPFGFAGGHHDSATGLVRMGARDYDPATGRFTAKDPIGLAGGLVSLYAYVGGDPVNRNDPSGLGPNDRFVTIYRYHGHPVPHLAIGIGTDFPSGLYPSNVIKPHSLGEINEDGKDADEILRVKVTPQQERRIRDYIERQRKHPPIYNMFSVGDSDTNNCATFVGEALQDSGLYQNTQAGYLPTNGWGQTTTAMTPGGAFEGIRAANPGSMYLNRD